MTKQEQIEKLMLDIPQTIVAYNANPKGQHLYREQRQEIAEAIYNAGYRKIENANGHNLPHEIDYLLTEFDEMGFVPTSLCDNPEGKAKLWKSALVYEIGLLLDEYAAIKEKAVKEFAGKIKNYINNNVEDEYGDMSDSVNYITIDIDEFETFIDNLLEEQNGKDKD